MDFSDKTELELVAEYAQARDRNDQPMMQQLQKEAFQRLESYLAGELFVPEDESPAFFSFIKTFCKTGNVDLDMLSKKAEAKITPFLKEFDRATGFNALARLSSEKVEENIAALEDFDTTDPFETTPDGLLYPQFQKVLNVMNAVVLTDDDGNPETSADEAETFKETIIETAKLKTYMRLCVYTEELTQELYLKQLRFEMEKALITLFMMEQTMDLVSDKTTPEEIDKAFEKLIELL